jgi:hypothetical protein
VTHTCNPSCWGGAEIRRMEVQSQPWQKARENSTQSISQVEVVCTCHPSYTGGRGRRISVWGVPQGKHWRGDPTWKIWKLKRTGAVAQVVEHPPASMRHWVQTPYWKKNKKTTYFILTWYLVLYMDYLLSVHTWFTVLETLSAPAFKQPRTPACLFSQGCRGRLVIGEAMSRGELLGMMETLLIGV